MTGFRVIDALLGRHFWILAGLALVAGFWLPGDYRSLRWSTTTLLGAILFFSCLNVRIDHLWREMSSPRLASRLGILSATKLVVLPVGAWVMTAAVAPSWADGMLLVSAMPAGLTSIAFTDLNRGNRILALMLVLVTSLVCPLTVPLLLDRLGPAGSHVGFHAMSERALYMVSVLVVPFVLAQIARASAISFVDRHPGWWTRGAILCSCLLVFASVAINREAWANWPPSQFVAPLVLSCAASAYFGAAAWVVYKRLDTEDTIAFACGALYMNNGLAVVLAVRFFPGNGRVLLPAVLMQLPMMSAMALLARVRHRR